MHPKKDSANSPETCENCTMRASISVQRTSDQNRPISTRWCWPAGRSGAAPRRPRHGHFDDFEPAAMIADELRRQADVFTDLVELQSKLGRDPSERPAPREPRHHAP